MPNPSSGTVRLMLRLIRFVGWPVAKLSAADTSMCSRRAEGEMWKPGKRHTPSTKSAL